MVLDGLFHDPQLFGREPVLQPGILHQDFAAGQVVDGAWTAEPQVVVGGYGVGHIEVGATLAGQFQRTAYDTCDVLHVVRLVEVGIARQYLGLDEIYEVKGRCSH